MRLAFTYLVTFVWVACVPAQVYVPFTEDSTRTWTAHVDSSPFGDCLETRTTSYWIDENNVLIDGLEYKRVRTRTQIQYSTILVFCEGFSEGPGPDIFIREVEHRVFAKESLIDTDHLIYDFDAVIGDTLPSPAFGFITEWDPVPVVLDIDSVLIAGAYRKRFSTSESCVIEGIGGCHGPFNPLLQGGLSFTQALDCVRESEVVVYGDPNCLFFTSIPEAASVQNIRIFPNPTDGPVTVNGRFDQLEVIDVAGREIRSKSSEMVDLSSQESGIYFLRVYYAGKLVGVRPIMVDDK